MPKTTFFNLPQEKQSRLLTIAAKEFAAHPYDAASISKIVRQAGIAKGSFYQYFEDKQDLYQTLVKSGTEAKLALLERLPTTKSKGDLFDYFRRQFLGTALFEVQQPDLAQVLYRAFVEEVPFPEMTEELRRRGTTQFFKQLIAQGITQGEVAVWVDPESAAFLLELIFYQFGKHLIRRLNLSDPNRAAEAILEDGRAAHILDNMMDLLEAGLKRDPQQRRDFFPKD